MFNRVDYRTNCGGYSVGDTAMHKALQITGGAATHKFRKGVFNMTYYLVTTARKKNARRHIDIKRTDLEELRSYGNFINKKYIVEIYNAKWELIETINP